LSLHTQARRRLDSRAFSQGHTTQARRRLEFCDKKAGLRSISNLHDKRRVEFNAYECSNVVFGRKTLEHNVQNRAPQEVDCFVFCGHGGSHDVTVIQVRSLALEHTISKIRFLVIEHKISDKHHWDINTNTHLQSHRA